MAISRHAELDLPPTNLPPGLRGKGLQLRRLEPGRHLALGEDAAGAGLPSRTTNSDSFRLIAAASAVH